jgi:hypothetical protein
VIEATLRIEALNLLAEVNFYFVNVLVCLLKLSASVAEEILHIWNTVPHIDGKCCTVLASRDAQNVTHRISHA